MNDKPNKIFNIWRIASPWLRVPLAWLSVAVLCGLLFLPALIVAIVWGAVIGAKEGAANWWHELIVKSAPMMRKAMFTWRAAA